MYAKGRGVLEDSAQAIKWARLAADQGLVNAQSFLGLKYAKGKGVPKDYVQAYKWLDLAATQGDQRAKINNISIRKGMTTPQIDQALKLSNSFKPTKVYK